MRKAIVLGVVGLFLASSAAFAGDGCGWGTMQSASSGSSGQTVSTDAATTKTPTTKETKG